MERKYSIVHTRQIVMHDSISFLKSCESLSFLVRDVVHITPENFHTCVAAIRTFVEASYKGELTTVRSDLTSRGRVSERPLPKSSVKRTPKNRNPPIRRIRSEPRNMDYDADEEEEDELIGEYTHVTMQLLDLMHTLHTRAADVHEAWAQEGGGGGGEGDLWDTAWCPVLQGMARLCCDRRAEIRTQALTLLQRSLLIPDLQVLQPTQWEFCFLRVLFPMLRKLLEPGSGPGSMTVSGREETKLRAAMMLSKVFLQHLGPLSSLPTFAALWLTILDFISQFVSTASTDLLSDALPESLKNMLLVMDTSGKPLFFSEETGEPTPLWIVTWEKIDTFLPTLRQETFGDLKTRRGSKPNPPADKVENSYPASLNEAPVEPSSLPSGDNFDSKEKVESDSVESIPPLEISAEQGEHYDAKPELEKGVPVATQALSENEPGPAQEPLLEVSNQESTIQPQSEASAAAAFEPTDATAPGAVLPEPPVATGIASYFFSSVISSQPFSVVDPGVGARDKFPSLPVNLNTQGTVVSTQGSTLNLQGTRVGPGFQSPTSPGPTSPIGSPIISSSAFSLPTSPSHPSSSPNILFSPIVPAPGPIGNSPIAAPTPVIPNSSNPVITPLVSNNMIGSSIQSTAFSPTNPLFLPTAPLPPFPTSVSPPNPPE